MAGAGSLPCGQMVWSLVLQPRAPVEQVCPNSPLRPVGGVNNPHCCFRDSRMVVYRLVGRDVRAAGGVSNDTVQPVGGVTLRLRLRLSYS